MAAPDPLDPPQPLEPASFSVRCRTCGVFYEQRENLLSGKMLWFPGCKCPVTKDSAEVLTDV